MDKCPHCNAEVFNHDLTKYCIACGKELKINTCKNSSCIICKEQVILPNYASYCPACGKHTTSYIDIDF
ncbi:zinc ribbon domain-containing protein [Clostridium sp. MB40-C1]|uniref:double zinc ribbon domain-containing protein n=1 Tax=Clostridium sp. MB40-C1 TaxID=3070996 RepID=UPI0027DFE9E3|nr:zinc ribbon domain-containing protein [Clostridium sp. MB40-C1]WMJ81936.1 zinc ribbon domain-containing protein [Clostridium sp. MB40-C1]